MFRGSLVALITPFKSAGEVDYAALKRLIDLHARSGTDGLVIGGTTGESPTLGRDEHAELIRQSIEMNGGRMQLIAGTGSNSTAQSIDLSCATDIEGVDGFLLVAPYYNKPPQRALIAHFTAIADAVTRPIMLYNVPGRTVSDILPETVARLAEHERIIAIKDATGEIERLEQQQAVCPKDFLYLSGDDFTACEFMLRGGHGVVSVTGNVAPALMAELCKTATTGKRKEAKLIDARLAALNEAMFVESNPIPVKWALKAMGYGDGSIRSPLVTLDEAYHEQVTTALKNADIL